MDRRFHRRHIKLVDPNKLTFKLLLAGVGTVGSWTAKALEKIGCSNIHIVDPDKVEPPNVGCQIYTSKDIGEFKIVAMGRHLEIPTTFSPYTVESFFEKDEKYNEFQLIINAVDSMDTRRWLFERLQPNQTLIDGRMAGNEIQIYTAIGNNPESMKKYEKTLFSSDKASPIPCGMKAVAYNGFVCAGLISDLVAQYANGQNLPAEILVDLKNFILFK